MERFSERIGIVKPDRTLKVESGSVLICEEAPTGRPSKAQANEGVKKFSEASLRSPAGGPHCGCYRPRRELIKATTCDSLSAGGAFGPWDPLFP